LVLGCLSDSGYCFVGANDVATTVAFDGFGDSFWSVDSGSVVGVVVGVGSRPVGVGGAYLLLSGDSLPFVVGDDGGV
jgi:hypothetical protein